MRERSMFPLITLGRRTLLYGAAPLILCTFIAGCSITGNMSQGSDTSIDALIIPSNFDQALKENQKVLIDAKGERDVALYNIGVISAHSANPKKDYSRALLAFRTLAKEYPSSWRTEQARLWIQALEEGQKSTAEAQKLAEEKRALARVRDQLTQERDQLTQERNKLNYAIEKSRQLDAAVEKRRKQSLKR